MSVYENKILPKILKEVPGKTVGEIVVDDSVIIHFTDGTSLEIVGEEFCP